MVDLPPSLDELNEYGRYAFLNEMHTMASQLVAYCTDDLSVAKILKSAIECIEDERGSMRKLFDGSYQRPSSKQAVALILRCAELYLDYGLWFELSHADLRLREKGIEEDVIESIKTCFHDTNLTDRYTISSPIIELTLTRLEMMTFFDDMQKQFFKGPELMETDPLSNYVVNLPDEPNEAEIFNECNIGDDPTPPSELIVDDEEYLELREKYVWSVYKNFRPLGSVFCLIWDAVFTAVIIESLVSEHRVFPATSIMSLGYAVVQLLFEIASFRLCFTCCLKPKNTIECLYPGYDLYYIQYFATWIAAIALIISMFVDQFPKSAGVTFFVFQMLVAVIVPFFFIPCFFISDKRVERKFKWVRVGFFNSCWWTFVKVVFCVLLTPGVHGVQVILASALRNKPSIGTLSKQKELVSTTPAESV